MTQDPFSQSGQSQQREETATSDEIFLHYVGEKFGGEMNARAMSIALMGMVDIVEQASANGAFGGTSKPELVVKATESGSFTIGLVLQWIAANGVGLGATFAGLTGFIKTLDQVFKPLRKKVPTEAKPALTENHVLVTFSDGSIIEMHVKQWKLLNNLRLRKAYKNLVQPLGMEGAPEHLELIIGGETLKIEPQDVEGIDQEIEISKTSISRTVADVYPSTVEFDSNTNKWAVNHRGKRVKVKIEDSQFLADVSFGKTRIGKNDKFKVKLRTEVTEIPGRKPKEEVIIEQVIEHYPGEPDEQAFEGEG